MCGLFIFSFHSPGGRNHCDPILQMRRLKHGASQVALVVKNPPANAGDTGDSGSIPGLGRSPGEGHDNVVLSNIKRSEELDLKFSSTINLPL